MKRTALSAALLALGVLLSGCGGNSGSGDGAGAGNADAATAQNEIKEYLEAPGEFPITEPLQKSVAGKKTAFLDCGTPVCAFSWTHVNEAAAELGLGVTRVDAGLQAETIATAFDSVTATKIDGVFNPALPNPLAQQGMEKLKAAGIPVIGGGVVNGDPKLFDARLSSEIATKKLGEILATYAVSEKSGEGEVVFYISPELELTTVMYEGFKAKYDALCPGCALRTADIPVATMGTTAPSLVTDDIQAHPNTKLALFSLGEQAIGLPAAMKTAGIEIETMAAAPSPDTLQQIKNGEMKAGIGFDFVYLDWAMADAMARVLAGQQIDPSEKADVIPMQVLTKDDITDSMVQTGWSAFPDMRDRFKALWAAAK